MKTSILLLVIFSIILTYVESVSTQDCYHGEDGNCCLCYAQWQCGLTGFYCPKTTTDFNINIYYSTTEKIIVSTDHGSAVYLLYGIAIGLVMAVILCFCAICIPQVRNVFVRSYVTAATCYYRTRSAEATRPQDVELGECSRRLADTIDLDWSILQLFHSPNLFWLEIWVSSTFVFGTYATFLSSIQSDQVI